MKQKRDWFELFVIGFIVVVAVLLLFLLLAGTLMARETDAALLAAGCVRVRDGSTTWLMKVGDVLVPMRMPRYTLVCPTPTELGDG